MTNRPHCIFLLLVSLWFCQSESLPVNSSSTTDTRTFSETLTSIANQLRMRTQHLDETRNTLVSPIPLARDAAVVLAILDADLKTHLHSHLHLFEGFTSEIRELSDHIRMVTSGEITFNSHIYAKNNNLRAALNDSITSAYSHEGFELLADHWEFNADPSVVLYTRTISNIHKLLSEGYWMEPIEFRPHDSSVLDAWAFRTVDDVEYAEFQIPKSEDCSAKALRLKYKTDLDLVFVLPTDPTRVDCLTSNIDEADLRSLNFTKQLTFVSVPVFNAGGKVDVKKKLEEMAIDQNLDVLSESFRELVVKHWARFSFRPPVPEHMAIPMITPDTPEFSCDRPFYFAVSHSSLHTPIVSGIVSNPTL